MLILSLYKSMYRMVYMVVACTVLFSSTAISEELLSTDDLVKAEKAAVESRKKIETGHFIISVTNSTFLADPNYSKYNFRYEIYLKGEEERVDTRVYLSGKSGSDNVTVFTKKTFIRANLSDDSIIQFYGPSSRPPRTLETPNPRLLGFVAWPFATINQFGLETYILRADRLSVSAEVREYQGEPAIEVSYQFNEGKEHANYILAVNKGYQPIYLAIWSGKGDSKVLHSAESTLTHHKRSDLWFPSKVVYRAQTGATLIQEQSVVVELAELNNDIEDVKFTLAGLGLKPGRLVANDDKLMWWTGKRLIGKTAGQDKYNPPNTGNTRENHPMSRSEGSRWFLLVNAMVLGVLCIIFLIRRIHKHRHSS